MFRIFNIGRHSRLKNIQIEREKIPETILRAMTRLNFMLILRFQSTMQVLKRTPRIGDEVSVGVALALLWFLETSLLALAADSGRIELS